jgi:hypothetical protein
MAGTNPLGNPDPHAEQIIRRPAVSTPVPASPPSARRDAIGASDSRTADYRERERAHVVNRLSANGPRKRFSIAQTIKTEFLKSVQISSAIPKK